MKRSTKKLHATADVGEVDVEIQIADLDDDQLEECANELQRRRNKPPFAEEPTMRERLCDLQSALIVRRTHDAPARFLSIVLGDELADAYAALQRGETALAICLIDKVTFPSKARTATQLPPKPQVQNGSDHAET